MMPLWRWLGSTVAKTMNQLAKRRVGDEELLPVEHPVVALLVGRALDAGRVAARRGLGDRVRGEEPVAGHAAEVLLLLLLGAGDEQRRGGQGRRGHRRLDAGAAVGELLDDEGVVELADARAAVLLGDDGRDDPELPRLLVDVLGNLASWSHLAATGMILSAVN